MLTAFGKEAKHQAVLKGKVGRGSLLSVKRLVHEQEELVGDTPANRSAGGREADEKQKEKDA